MKATKLRKEPKDEHAVLKASPEFKVFEEALDRVLKAPKTEIDRLMAEQHPKRKKPDN